MTPGDVAEGAAAPDSATDDLNEQTDGTSGTDGQANGDSANGSGSHARLAPDIDRVERGGSRRPRIVLVLGGGGMRGWSHIGVIRAIERLGLHIDEVIGTSMGSVIGGLYACGEDSFAIEKVAEAFSVKDYFKLNLLKFLVKGYRHASVYKGKAFYEALQRILPEDDFSKLQRPFFCNALSMTTGGMQYFGLPGAPEVRIGDAVYASCTLPGVFEPKELAGDYYIDGGMAETLCLKLAHSRGADLIIACDLGIKDHHTKTPYRATLPHILFHTWDLMGIALNEHNLHRYVDEKVVLMRPKVGHVGVLDSPDVSELIRLGEREALEMLSTHHLTRYLCDEAAVEEVDRTIRKPRDYVELNVDMNACINCGICAVTCATSGFANVPLGDVVRKLHNYECTRDMACERACPTKAIRLQNL
jgi:NTE family protein